MHRGCFRAEAASVRDVLCCMASRIGRGAPWRWFVGQAEVMFLLWGVGGKYMFVRGLVT
jgi:hypothetical protein